MFSYNWFVIQSFSSPFSMFGVGAVRFHSPRSPVFVSCVCTPVSFFMLTLLHLSCLPIFQCPIFSIFHVLITTASCFFLSTCPNHLSFTSLIVSPMFATPALIHVLLFLLSWSSQSSLFPSSISTFSLSVISIVYCSAFLSVHASLPHNQNWSGD